MEMVPTPASQRAGCLRSQLPMPHSAQLSLGANHPMAVVWTASSRKGCVWPQPLEDTISRTTSKHQGQQQAQYILAAPMMGWISYLCSCLFLCPSWLVSLVSPVSCSGWGCYSCVPVQYLAWHRSLKRCSVHRKVNGLGNTPFTGLSVLCPSEEC